MPIVYDIKSDIRYQQGTKVGIEQGIKQGLEQGFDKHVTITVVSMLLKTDFTNKKITGVVAVEIPFVIKWAKALAKYEVKKIWSSFKIIEGDKKITLKRAIATATALVKINGLSDEVVGKICELKKAKIAQIRVAEKKKLTNEKGTLKK